MRISPPIVISILIAGALAATAWHNQTVERSRLEAAAKEAKENAASKAIFRKYFYRPDYIRATDTMMKPKSIDVQNVKILCVIMYRSPEYFGGRKDMKNVTDEEFEMLDRHASGMHAYYNFGVKEISTDLWRYHKLYYGGAGGSTAKTDPYSVSDDCIRDNAIMMTIDLNLKPDAKPTRAIYTIRYRNQFISATQDVNDSFYYKTRHNISPEAAFLRRFLGTYLNKDKSEYR
jgi:hypothetical protein